MCLLIFCGRNKATVLALTECDCRYLASESDGSPQNNNVTGAGGEAGLQPHKHTNTHMQHAESYCRPLCSIHPFCVPHPCSHPPGSSPNVISQKVGSWGVQRGCCFYSRNWVVILDKKYLIKYFFCKKQIISKCTKGILELTENTSWTCSICGTCGITS